jgi:integrase
MPSGQDGTFPAVTPFAPAFDLSLESAINTYLVTAELAPTSIRTYRHALEPLTRVLGPETILAAIDAEYLEHAATQAWGRLGPATWNRNVAALNSFLRWSSAGRDPQASSARHLPRRREPADRSRAIPYGQLERLWSREGLPLREKTLYRLLYETAGRASEVLALDVEDLDLPNKRARIRSKGGDLELVHFQSGSARLLPRLLAGRRHGPVFLTDRAAPAGTPSLDVCPVTGRARLSYRRAAALFAKYTGGWTLHQLRHSAITHLAEAGESTVLLMAKSRHRSLRTLQRYARPGPGSAADDGRARWRSAGDRDNRGARCGRRLHEARARRSAPPLPS